MLTRQDILTFLRDNKEYLQKHFHLTKVGIFGSFAREEQKADSDIDLLIEMEDETKDIFDGCRSWRWLVLQRVVDTYAAALLQEAELKLALARSAASSRGAFI